ncbi:MAG: hypothetical protein HYY16_14545, partial [Planctomycetes bacterium]|nr:hypothetical protein [Planctomycetota bacterium]
ERFYKWDVRTEEYLKEPWQITQGYEPISKMLLGKNGFEEPAWRRQAFGESLTERGAREVVAGRITYVRNPRYGESAPFQAGEHHEIIEALRALRFANEFIGVELTAESMASVRAIIGETRASGKLAELLLKPLFAMRFNVALEKLQYTSRDNRRLFDLLEEAGLTELARENGISLRTPLAKAPPEDGAAVERLGRSITVYHGTKGGYKAAWGIARGGLFMSESGSFGAGAYTATDPQHALSYANGEADFVVRVRLSPDARVGGDVEIHDGIYLLKTDRAVEGIERPLMLAQRMARLESLLLGTDGQSPQAGREYLEDFKGGVGAVRRVSPHARRLLRVLEETDGRAVDPEENVFRRELREVLRDFHGVKATVLDREIDRLVQGEVKAPYSEAMTDWAIGEILLSEGRAERRDRIKVALVQVRQDLSPERIERDWSFLSYALRYERILPDEARPLREAMVRQAARIIEDVSLHRVSLSTQEWAGRFLEENRAFDGVYARLSRADREELLRWSTLSKDSLWKIVRTEPDAGLRAEAWRRLVPKLSSKTVAGSAEVASVIAVIPYEPDPEVRRVAVDLLGSRSLPDWHVGPVLRDLGPAAEGFEDARRTPAWRSGAGDSEFTRAAIWKALEGLERGDPEAVGAVRKMLEGWIREGRVPDGPDGRFSSLRALAYFAKQVPEKEFQSVYRQAQDLIDRRVRGVLGASPEGASLMADAWKFLLEQMDGWKGLREFPRTRDAAVGYAMGFLQEQAQWIGEPRRYEEEALEFLHRAGKIEEWYARMSFGLRGGILWTAERLYKKGRAPWTPGFLRKVAGSDPHPQRRLSAWYDLMEGDPTELRRLFPALEHEGVPELRWLLRADAARFAEKVTASGLLAYLEGQEGFVEARRERAEARTRGGLTPLEGPVSTEMYKKLGEYGEDLRLTPAWRRARATGEPFDGLPFGRAKVWRALEDGTDSSLVEMRRMLQGWIRQGEVPEGPDGYASSLNGLIEFASRAKAREGQATREFVETFEGVQDMLAERAIKEIRGIDHREYAFTDSVEFLFKLRAGDAMYRGYLSLSPDKQWAAVGVMDKRPRRTESYVELLERVADSAPDPSSRRAAWSSLARAETSPALLDRVFRHEGNPLVQFDVLQALVEKPPDPAGSSAISRLAKETTHPQILAFLVAVARGGHGSSSVVAEALRQRPDYDVLSKTSLPYNAFTFDWGDARKEDPRLTPAWQRAHAGPQNRVVGRWAVREAMGAAQFGAAYLVKEAAKARSVRQVRESALAMKEPMFWGSLGVFSGSAQLTRAGLRWVPMPRWARGVSMAAFPLAVGMGAMQGMAGQFSPKDLAVSTGVFLGAGTVVDVAARLMMRSSTGWWLGVAKLAATLYLAEAVEGRLRPASAGVRERIEGIVP